MKRVVCSMLLFVLLVGALPAHAAVIKDILLLPFASTSCKHTVHIRRTENTIQHTCENESVHLKQEVFETVCAECGKDPQTVIDKQTVETHTWELTYDYCNKETGMHEYTYVCACRVNSFKVRCTGIHEQAPLGIADEEIETE